MRIDIREAKTYAERLWGLVSPFKKNLVLCLFLILLSSLGLGAFLTTLIPLSSSILPASAPGSSGGAIKTLFDFYNVLSPEETQKVLVLGSLLMFLVNSSLGVLVTYATAVFSAKVVNHTRTFLAQRILWARFSFVSSKDEGDVIQVLITEARGVYAVVKQCLGLVIGVIRAAILSTILVVLSPLISAFLLVVGVLLSAVTYGFGIRIRALGKEGLRLRFSLMGQAKEAVTQLRHIKIDCLEDQTLAGFGRSSIELEKNVKRVRVLTDLVPLISQMIVVCAVFAIAMWSMRDELFPPELSPIGGMLVYLAILALLVSYISAINRSVVSIVSNLPAVGTVFEYLYGQEILDGQENRSGDTVSNLFTKELLIDDVHFGYENSGSYQNVLKGVNLRIHKGDRIALVGKSGVGKSTLLNLLLRLYEPMSGEIRFDGSDTRKLKVSDIRSRIGYVCQDVKLFNTTIRENLLIAKPHADFSALREACVMADAHAFISELAQGYETKVGERGEKLSGGQRQRIALARVFLKDPEVVVLDEAVSAIDSNSVENIRESILKRFGDRTIIIVSHHANAIQGVDRTIALKDGKAVEVQSFDEIS